MELDLSAALSHELKAPLRGIEALAEAFLEDCREKPLDDEGRGLVERLRSETRALTRLVDDILELSRAEDGELRIERVDLSRLSKELVARLRAQEPARVVDVIVDPELFTFADPTLLRVALGNLVANAWKYTRDRANARIAIGCAEHPTDGRAYFVSDNGIGFEPVEATSLFRPFHRLKGAAAFDGSGLGLTIVEKVIARHGGTIWAEGSTGQGATFWFKLPSAGGLGSEPLGVPRPGTSAGPTPPSKVRRPP